MGFFSEIDGELKPSDDYLASHELPGYEEGDMEHDDYEITDDTVAVSLMPLFIVMVTVVFPGHNGLT